MSLTAAYICMMDSNEWKEPFRKRKYALINDL